MARALHELKDEIKTHADEIKIKVEEIFGNHTKDIDFSYIDLMTVLYCYSARHKPEEPGWLGRDRIIISDLKALPSLFAVTTSLGYMEWKDCKNLIVNLPRFFSNPNLALVNYPGVDFMTNSSYLGLIHSIGYAIAGQQSRLKFRVFHVLNGEKNTSIQESLMSANRYKLKNLTCAMPYLDSQKRSSAFHFWFSMGWQLEEVRYDDIGSILEGFARALKAQDKPQILLG